jgi:hypothetical protein
MKFEELTHGSIVRASADIQICAFLCRIRCIISFAGIHQVQAVPLLDTQLFRQLVRDIVDDTVKVPFNSIGNVVFNATQKRAD